METSQPLMASSPLKLTAKILTVITLFLGVSVLCGWITGNETLKRGIAGGIAMNPLSAVCFLLCAIALWIRNDAVAGSRRISLANKMALAVSLIGFLKITSMILRINFRLVTLLFHARAWEPAMNDYNKMA